MHRGLRRALAAALVALAIPAVAWAADPAGLAHLRAAIAAERVAKLQAQLARGLLPQRASRALTQAVHDLDAAVAAARAANVPSPEQRDNALLLAILWREARPWALKPAARDSERQLGARSEEIAWVALKGAALARGMPEDPAVEAARGAVMAQRIARLELARRGAEPAADPQGRVRELRLLLERLGEGGAAEGDLAVARSQLEFLARSVGGGTEGPAERERLEFLVKSADHVGESLERAAARLAEP